MIRDLVIKYLLGKQFSTVFTIKDCKKELVGENFIFGKKYKFTFKNGYVSYFYFKDEHDASRKNIDCLDLGDETYLVIREWNTSKDYLEFPKFKPSFGFKKLELVA